MGNRHARGDHTQRQRSQSSPSTFGKDDARTADISLDQTSSVLGRSATPSISSHGSPHRTDPHPSPSPPGVSRSTLHNNYRNVTLASSITSSAPLVSPGASPRASPSTSPLALPSTQPQSPRASPSPADLTAMANIRFDPTHAVTEHEVIRDALRYRSFDSKGQKVRREDKNRRVEGPVAYATLEWLVVAMTDSSSTDYTLRDMVLLLHPRFCSSTQLARALIQRYQLMDGGLVGTGGERKPEGSPKGIVSNSILGMVSIAEVESGKYRGSTAVSAATLSRSQSSPTDAGFMPCPVAAPPASGDDNTISAAAAAAAATAAAAAATAIVTQNRNLPKVAAKTELNHSPEPTGPPKAPARNQYNSLANQKLRVRLQVLSVFSMWIKSDLFSGRDKRSAGLLEYVRVFFRSVSTRGPPGQRKVADNLLSVCNKETLHAGDGRWGPSAGGTVTKQTEEIPRTPDGGVLFTSPPRQMELVRDDADPGIIDMILERGAARFFFHHTPREVAMAMTYVTHDVVSRVLPRELVSEGFGVGTAAEKTSRYPSYMRAVRSFNSRVQWVQAVILCEENSGYPSRRSMNISFFIDVASECLRFANFQTALEIVSALSAPCINLVSNNMTVVSEKSRQEYEKLKRVISQDDNYELYREAYASCSVRPHVPLLPVTTQDLMRVESGSHSFHTSSERLINVRKFNKMYEIIEAFEQCGEMPYTARIRLLVSNAGEAREMDRNRGDSLGGDLSEVDGVVARTTVSDISDGSAAGVLSPAEDEAPRDTYGIDLAELLQRIGERDVDGGGPRGSVRSTSSQSSPKLDGPAESNLIVTQELVRLMSRWLCPPPSSTELYTAAARILATESKNLVATLDYLGL